MTALVLVGSDARTAGLRPPRLNAAGFCDVCFQRWCTRSTCIEAWSSETWALCPVCGGEGYDTSAQRCRCLGGLVPLAEVG